MGKQTEGLTYLQAKVKPFVIATITKHGKRRTWQVCRDIDSEMPAPPAHSTIEKLLPALVEMGDLVREKIDREWVYSVNKRAN